jgi:hypothetical protein
MIRRLNAWFDELIFSMHKPTKPGTRERKRETVFVIVVVGFVLTVSKGVLW